VKSSGIALYFMNLHRVLLIARFYCVGICGTGGNQGLLFSWKAERNVIRTAREVQGKMYRYSQVLDESLGKSHLKELHYEAL